MVRTIGYGASTTFTTTASGYAAGELTLGADNSGTSFASRPSSLSFWAQYSAYNAGDTGLAEVSVLDASGNVIASGSTTVAPSSAYLQQSIALTYAKGAAKAATIKVRFRSSATDNFRNKNGVSAPKSGAITGHFTGSYMWIDDVELAY